MKMIPCGALMAIAAPCALAVPPLCVPLPKVVHLAQPRYPAVEFRVAQDVTLTLEFTIREDGTVTDAVVIERDPPDLLSFDESALWSMTHTRFARMRSACRGNMRIAFRTVERP
jgi:TonB family protein